MPPLDKERHFGVIVFLGKDEKLLVSLDQIFSRTHGITIPSEVTSPVSGIKFVSAIKH